MKEKDKKMKQIGHDLITINGIEYVKKDSLGVLDGLSLDNIHIIIHRKNVEIKGKVCFYCGNEFVGKNNKKLTKHHGIDKRLKSKYNVFVPICEDCHQKINKNIKRKK